MSQEPICPCEELIHPRPISNPPGRDTLLYRVGDFATFREALLQARPGEQELAGWRPSTRGDLALQLLEWWAYLADILTFYNERIAQDAYLRTAASPGTVERLVRVLGYRPRPGLGATGVLAALINSRLPLTLPRGLAIQSKPGPGKKPEIFELDEDTRLEPSGSLAAEVVDPTNLAGRTDVLLRGSLTTVREGEQLLLVSKDWAKASDKGRGYAVVTVQAVSREKDSRGRSVTRITFDDDIPGTIRPSNSEPAPATNYRLLRASQTAQRFPYGSVNPGNSTVHLESIFRSARSGEQLLLKSTSGAFTLSLVTNYAEQVWYANDANPTIPPTEPAAVIPIPHTVLTFSPAAAAATVQVHFGWQEVGELIDIPPASVLASGVTLALDAPLPLPQGATSRLVLLEDSKGQGTQGRATPFGSTAANQVHVSEIDSQTELIPPLRLLHNLLPVSRGATVAREVLGSGDSSRANQSFVLQKSPLTYLREGAGYRSTLRIWVDSIEWKEVPSFYGQAPDAHIFVTREDEEQKTQVLFGDGVQGARLPTGLGNVVASYRHGSGASAPEAGTLSVLLQSHPGLQSVRNPVPVTGGADPDPAAKLRQLAPRSVLTFGRAISAGDYEALALESPSVNRARAYWTFDTEQQRPLIKLYVGDTPEAKTSAELAIRSASDPQRRVEVLPAQEKPVQLKLEVLKDPRFLAEEVEKGIRRALMDPETGLFGVKTARIGTTVYNSQIYEACLRVPGTLAVHLLLFMHWDVIETWPNHSPGEGGFYVLEDLKLTLKEAATHA
ncbi:putative baseplate assembly protein [Archangium violaceum]|uniref:putative baseplate assembly protein n=1 Tax=Archangium violaceum TaxID=83451 RepID=UPI002B2ED9A3|nr:putative baseplate assembly protein [Archangium violaceum]